MPDNTEEHLRKTSYASTTEVINLIQASPEIKKLCEKEFKEAKINLEHITEQEQRTLYNILQDYFQAFSSSLKSLGHTDIIEPQINFTTNYLIKSLPFPIPQSLQVEAKKQIDEMVEASILEKNVATWVCPLILVKKKKKDRSKQKFRTTLDLRLLNAVIQLSSYPLPKTQEIINNIAEYKYFTRHVFSLSSNKLT